MIRLLADENIEGDLVTGTHRRHPEVVFESVHGLGMDGNSDPDLLEWCVGNRFVLVTHDRQTLPGFAYERLAATLPMSGLFVVPPDAPLSATIDELAMLAQLSEPDEWEGRVLFLPYFR